MSGAYCCVHILLLGNYLLLTCWCCLLFLLSILSEKRRLTIPSNMGYGDRGSPPKILGKATLVFDVELLEIKGNSDEL